MMGWYSGFNGWMVVMMLCWALLLAAAVWAVLALTRRSDRPPDLPATARQVLDGRFAAGQVSRQEYLDARALLEQSGPGPT